MYKIVDKLYAGFSSRQLNNGTKFHLSFIVKDKTLKSFNDWRTKSLGVKEFDNVPTAGFRVFGETSRDRSWFGSGRSMVYVEHPTLKAAFEISVENLIAILEFESIRAGIISGQLILAHEGARLILIPTASPDYKQALQDTVRINSKQKVKASTLVAGNEIEFKNKERVVYLGCYPSVIVKEATSSRTGVTDVSVRPAGLRHFWISSEYPTSIYMKSVHNINVFAVTNNTTMTLDSVKKKFIKNSRSDYYPMFPSSKIELRPKASKKSRYSDNIQETGRLGDFLIDFQATRCVSGWNMPSKEAVGDVVVVDYGIGVVPLIGELP